VTTATTTTATTVESVTQHQTFVHYDANENNFTFGYFSGFGSCVLTGPRIMYTMVLVILFTL
jgi:hypothetical protein